MTRQRRGAALMLVLVVLALVLVIVFALLGASMMNLHLARGFTVGTRSSLLAQAAVQHFIAAYDRVCAQARQNGVDLERRDAVDLGLRALYASKEGVPDRGFDEMQGEVRVDFDAGAAWHSTDNSLSEYPAASWLDRGTAARSVPPFSVELLVSVEVDGSLRHYRAVVSRHWPYAVFGARGAVVVCGSPTAGGIVAPSRIEGQVATLEAHPPHGLVPITPRLGNTVVGPRGPRYLQPDTAADLLGPATPPPLTTLSLSERMRAALGLESRCDALVDAAVTVGPRLRFSRPPTDGPDETPARVESAADFDVTTVPLPPRSGPRETQPLEEATEAGNVVCGDAYLATETRGAAGVAALPDNSFTGQVIYDAFPAGLDVRHNPADDARFPASMADYRLIPRPVLPAEMQNELAMADAPGATTEGDEDITAFGLLFGTLTLDPELADAPPWQLGGHNRFVFHGDLGNRFVRAVTAPRGPAPSGPPEITGLRIFETSGGLRLRNALLYVDGNLDLSARPGSPHEVVIEGSNSTLLVNGTLALWGGRLDARDQGMVIMARDVVLRARGEYRGLIIARNSLTILPAEAGGADGMLNIRGGILCGNQNGDTVLRSVQLTYDPVYMKAVHAYGRATCTEWRELP